MTFLGHREIAIGYDEAIAKCFEALLQRSQQTSPEVAAVVAALRSQVGRPPDPIWDPDPAIARAVLRLAADDPALERVRQWEREAASPRPDLAAVIGDVAVSAPQDGAPNIRDRVAQRLDPAALHARLGQIGRFDVPRDVPGGG